MKKSCSAFSTAYLCLRYLLAFAAILQLDGAVAQSDLFPYIYYGPAQGLSDNLVTDIEQDTLGFLWLSTSDGLNQFDGYSFRSFGPGSPLPGRLSGRNIASLNWTHDQRLLITYRNNIDYFELFNPYTFQVEKVNLYPINGVQGSVQHIRTDPNGQIYVLTTSLNTTRVYRYQTADSLILHTAVPHPDNRITQVHDFLPLSGGDMLIYDLQLGLYQVNTDHQIHEIPLDSFFLPVFDDQELLRSVIFQWSRHRDRVFISFEQTPRLFEYDPSSRDVHRLNDLDTTGGKEYTYLWEDELGNALISQTDGSGQFPITEQLFFLPKGGTLQNWTYLTRVTKYMVSLYAPDFHNILFFGADTGLKIYYNTQFRQENYLSRPLAPDEFGAVMRGITSDCDSTVFLTREYRYWYRLDEASGRLDTLRIRPNADEPMLDFKCSFDLFFQAPNNLWGIACQGDGNGLLINYNTLTGLSRIFEYPMRFQNLLADGDETIWLTAGNPTGRSVLVRFDPRSGAFTEYLSHEGKNPFQRYLLNCIVQGKENELWIGTNRGLLRFLPQRDQLDVFTTEEGLISNTIQCLTVDSQQRIWVGTSDGITLLDQNGAFLQEYTTEDALCNNNISSIVEDHLGNIWVTTTNGLSVLAKGAELFRNYYYMDGFPSDHFTTNSALMSANGYLYVGTVNGFSRFKPENLLQQRELPAPQFSLIQGHDIESNSRRDNCTATCRKQGIRLQPEDDYLDLSFFLPYYQSPDKNSFRIKMEPLESEWNELGTKNTFRYQRIPPGKYTIHLQASDPSGQWSPKTTQLSVQVLPNWYETRWAYVSGVLILFLLIYAGFRYSLRQKLKVAQMRTKISSDIHDEISGLLSGIALQSDLLLEEATDPSQKQRLQHIGTVSRKAVSQIHDVIWSIDSRKDHMEDLLMRMREHAEDVLLPRDIAFSLEHQQVDLRKRLPVIVRQNVYFIYKEAINNVAKHSGATKASVYLERNRESLILIIRDNGQHKPRPSAPRGQGIQNMHMRAQRIKGKLELHWNKGCTIQLTLPRW